MTNWIPFKDILEEALKDPDVKAEWDRTAHERLMDTLYQTSYDYEDCEHSFHMLVKDVDEVDQNPECPMHGYPQMVDRKNVVSWEVRYKGQSADEEHYAQLIKKMRAFRRVG